MFQLDDLHFILDKMDSGIYPTSPLTIRLVNIPTMELWERFQHYLMQSTFPSDYQIIFDLRPLANPHWITDAIHDVLHRVGAERCPLNLIIKYQYSAKQKQDVDYREQQLIAMSEEIRTISTEKLYGAIFAALSLNMSIDLMPLILVYLVQGPHHDSGPSATTLITQTIEKQIAITDKKGFALFGFFPSEDKPKPDSKYLVALLTQNLNTQFDGIESVSITYKDLIITFKDRKQAETVNNIIKATNIKTVSDSTNMLRISGKNIQKFMDAYGKMDATLLFASEYMGSSCAIS